MIWLLLLFLLVPAQLYAAITSTDTNTAEADSISPADTLVLLVSDTMVVGRIGLLRVASDNVAATDADHNEHTGVTDTAGNLYSKLCEWTNSNAGAGNGITGSLWVVRVTTELAAAQTITVQFANSVTARVAKVHEFSVGAGNTLGIVAGSGGCNVVSYDGIDVGSKATTAVASASTLWYRPIYDEGQGNAITVTTNYTAMNAETAGAGSDAASVTITGEFRISTNTIETSDPTMADTNDDFLTFFVALREVSATPTTRRRGSARSIN